MTTLTLVAGAPPRDRLEWAAVAGLLGFVSALQLSIAAASICLAVTLACWAGALALGQERWDAPRFFWPLLVYAAWTLISAAFSPDPRTSFIDSKQLVVFLLVPAVYQLARGNRALQGNRPVKVRKHSDRGRVRIVVGRHINRLHRGNGTCFRGGDTFLQLAHFFSQRRLVTHR